MEKLHIDCLIKWIEYKDSIYCDICRTQYNIPHNVILEYYNQQSQNVSVNESNDYYLNSYNNDYNYDNQDKINSIKLKVNELMNNYEMFAY